MQIGIAMLNWESAHGRLPGTIRDASGRPLLSVRVALLPYIEEEELYRQFHLDEPWDSPHNLSLLDKMPMIYASMGADPPEESQTFYRLVTGPGTAFEKEGLSLADFAKAEGTGNTVFWVESGEAVSWTKPEEFEVHPDRPLPPLGGMFRRDGWIARRRGLQDGTHIAFGDASVRWIPRDVPEATWRKLLMRDGAKAYFP
jgi:hypothetical protein